VAWAFIYLGVKQSWINKNLYFGIPANFNHYRIDNHASTPGLCYGFLVIMFLGFTGTIEEVKPVNPKEYYLLYGVSGILALGGIYLAIKNKVNSLYLAWACFFIFASIAEKRWG
jgi:hypothetical protein